MKRLSTHIVNATVLAHSEEDDGVEIRVLRYYDPEASAPIISIDVLVDRGDPDRRRWKELTIIDEQEDTE